MSWLLQNSGYGFLTIVAVTIVFGVVKGWREAAKEDREKNG